MLKLVVIDGLEFAGNDGKRRTTRAVYCHCFYSFDGDVIILLR